MNNRLSGLLSATVMSFACALMALFTVVFAESEALAHKVNVFAYIEGDSIIVEGYFGGKAKAQNSPVEVFNPNGKKLLEGRTDAKGVWSFSLKSIPTGVKSIKIVLEAELGHKGEYALNLSDGPVSSEKLFSENPTSPDTLSASLPMPVSAGAVAPVMDQEALLQALSLMMDRKIEPLIKTMGAQERLLLEQQAGSPKMKEIIGGIGWILGLAGITAFFWGKKS